MRFVIARLSHETNTFSPLPTPLEAFAPKFGDAARTEAEGSPTAVGAFVAFAEARGAEAIMALVATANPSGPVADEAFETLAGSVVKAVSAGCEAVLLDLHGAMVTQSYDDGEGELLRRIRAIAPAVPIAIALDLHGNVTPQMLDNADILVGFKTYPHIDMRETGEHVARILGRMLDEGFRPKRALCHPPLLAHTLKMNTSVSGAMQDAIAAAEGAEGVSGVLAASVFGGFSHADIPDAGMSIVVVAESETLANAVAQELGEMVWQRRSEFVYDERPLAESVAHACSLASTPGKGPVLILDHGDNCMSGGTCDTMEVLQEALRQDLDSIVIGPICDPKAVASLTAAGVGAKISLGIGNCTAINSLNLATGSPPLQLDGTVEAISDGSYVISGPTYTGMLCSMGAAAVLNTGRVKIVVSQLPHEPWDLAVFTSLGIDPTACRFLILKSRMYCRPVFEPITRAVVECASIGVTSSNYGIFPFAKVSRPVFPLDPGATWR